MTTNSNGQSQNPPVSEQVLGGEVNSYEKQRTTPAVTLTFSRGTLPLRTHHLVKTTARPNDYRHRSA
ncbi:MAG: hypothetical protein M3Y12_09835 [Bacteroidota bacterium]|nr:hypothetical protein [Bacteroidota bacterium]